MGLEETLHLPLQGSVPEVCISSVSLHVSDLDLRDALAPFLLLQADPEDRNLVLEDVVAALQPAEGNALIYGSLGPVALWGGTHLRILVWYSAL